MLDEAISEQERSAWLERLKGAKRCLRDIEPIGEELTTLSDDALAALAQSLIDHGEDVALGLLLNGVAYTGRIFCPTLLAESIKVVADIDDIMLCYNHQGVDAIAPLMATAQAEDISREQKVIAARLATELTLKHDHPTDDIRRMLQHFATDIGPDPKTELLVIESLAMLESDDEISEDHWLFPRFSEFDIHEWLPERAADIVIGDGLPVRRAVEKLGRNSPCHCGSGKKYKRCCHAKDQEALGDSSHYQGITQTQIRENPGIVDDPDYIMTLRAYELKKIDLTTLTTDQLLPAYRSAAGFGLFEIGLNALDLRAKRDDGSYEFDPGHYADLMTLALQAGEIEIAKQARARIPDDFDCIDQDETAFEFALQEESAILTQLESRCAMAIRGEPTPLDHDPHHFCDLAYLCRKKYPALGIVMARNGMLQEPTRLLDNDAMGEHIQHARITLDLDPWDDPAEQLLDRANDDHRQAVVDSARAKTFDKLTEEAELAKQQKSEKMRELAAKEETIRQLKRELEAKSDAAPSPQTTVSKPAAETTETLTRLRRQVGNLKAEIGHQQDRYRQSREELQKERKRRAREAHQREKSEDAGESNEGLAMPDPGDRPVLLPEYSETFRHACHKVPTSVAGSALKAVASFAAYDSSIWRHACGLRAIPGVYRIRIGIHYRALLRWQPGHALTALDLIPRQELETWIRRHSG